ncbi:hypothetical protein BC936DRAFT_142286 [Jimgerdemannia flammicorona]|uniref:Uncharacterized protein n=1 Tax=Jimgerdemannia flammicorona TaxID=994334 RepID=A0A433A0Q0_9FUNG|nr:hypothetical protein BC936DRAFT_142286 [Jimgerdemannia flammicorona]
MTNPIQQCSHGSYARFLVYLVFLFLAYQLIHTFFTSQSTTPQSEENPTVHPELHKANPLEEPSKPDPTPARFPLHISKVVPHPPTTKLSSQERTRLETFAARNARQAAELTLSAFNLTGIPGSVLATADQVRRFRFRLDCFTSTAETGGGARWVYDNTPRVLVRHLQEPIYSRCDKRHIEAHGDEDGGSGWNVRESVKYVWSAPSDCPLKPINRADWCQMLDGRHVLLAGDPLQFQLHEMWVDIFRDGPVVCFGELNCKDHTICNPPNHKDARVRYLRNDILSTVRRNPELADGHPDVRTVQLPWITHNMLAYYPIAILNRSPSPLSDTDFAAQLIDTVRAIRQDYPQTLLLYRNTPVGHPGCNAPDLVPLVHQPTESELQDLPYHWGEAKRQNAIAKEIIEAAGGVYIDVATMTNMRPDGHIGGQDCLRYCIPGPLDAWMLVLYNVFRMLNGLDEV